MAYGEAELEHRGVTIGPCPANFDLTPFSIGDRDPRAMSDRGLCHWLNHAQNDLTGPDRVFTSRSIKQASGDEGLQAVARFDVDFHPDHERVVLHAVRVHRGDETRDALHVGSVEILRRELNLERAVYDGRRTMHLVIPDVRLGDVVETIYSLVGSNPALKDSFAWWFVLQWSVPVAETRCVVLAPASCIFTVRKLADAPDAEESIVDGVRRLDWRIVDLQPYRQQPGTPGSYTGFQAVHVAEALTWAQVSDIFRPMYDPPTRLPSDMEQRVTDIATAHVDLGMRLLAGLRLVQGLLRYHSVGVGEGGYRPRSVDEIWETRYGDCKDGSLLLASVLRALDIDATCALVATTYGADLAQTPPNAQAFNHCVVRARIGHEVFWLDATLSTQAGSLQTLTQNDYHWALPLEPDAALQAMNVTPLLTVCETTEDWTFAIGQTGPARLELTTIYRGWRADGVRRWIANDGPVSVQRHWREGLEKEIQSPLTSSMEPTIQDASEANSLRVVEHYDVERPLVADGQERWHFVSRDDVVGPHVELMGPEKRIEPFQLGLPRTVVTMRILNFPIPIQIAPWSETFHGPNGLSLETSLRWDNPKRAVHRLVFTARQSVLPIEAADAYREFATRARRNNGITFLVPFENGRIKKIQHGPSWKTWATWVGIVAALALFRWAQG